ncbi:MAG: hypothetical protein U0573_11865 [Phycisphaerales bacterium]|nr:hypothetical protein [Planctomycetota bacterium]
MPGQRILRIALGLLASLHAAGAVWCVTGALDARSSDLAAFHAVAGPLKEKGDISPAGMTALEQNVQRRSSVHATVMYSYAAVHTITAVGIVTAIATIRRMSKGK